MSTEKETRRRLSRREFVKGAAGAAAVAGAGVLAGCSGAEDKSAPTTAPAEQSAPWLPEKWDVETDVVVVGYGGAGAAAAIEAYDKQASVLILEKMAKGGGTTAMSGGNFATPMRPLNLEKVVGYLQACGKGRTDKDMATAWAQEAVTVGEWMKDYLGGDITESLRTGYHPKYEGVEEISSWAPTVGAGTWQIEGEGLFKILSDAVEARGIEVRTETAAKELLVNLKGEVVGLLAEAGGTQLAIKARRGVILTCGGFEHNDWMKQHYLRTYPVYGFSNVGNTGDAITMAGKLGAKIWKISELAGFLAHKFPGEDRTWLSMLQFVIGSYSAIIVNRHGQRFTDETLSYDTFHKELNRYDPVADEYPNVPAYCIFDEATKTTLPMGYGPGWSTDNNAEIEKGWIVKADTFGELATKIGMNPETLEATVKQYNECCAAGKDPDFGRTALIPLGAGPYYAMEGYPGTTSTWGGPKINTKAQVVDTYEHVIPRLYAAGVASCGVLGFWYFGNGGNLGDAFAFGRIAGRTAAAETPWE